MIQITKVCPYRRTKLFEVVSETGPEFIANEKFLLENGIRVNERFSEEEFETIRARAQILDGIRKSVDILSRKDYSKKELIRKLCDRGIPEDAAETAARYMEEHGYQNDLRYALRLAELAKQTYGEKRVTQILYQHGINRETAKEAIERTFPDDGIPDEEEKLDRILSRAAKGKDLSDPAQRHKIFAKLARLGYGSSEISAAFSRYGAEGDGDLP